MGQSQAPVVILEMAPEMAKEYGERLLKTVQRDMTSVFTPMLQNARIAMAKRESGQTPSMRPEYWAEGYWRTIHAWSSKPSNDRQWWMAQGIIAVGPAVFGYALSDIGRNLALLFISFSVVVAALLWTRRLERS